jgi:MFS family permease
VSGRLRQLSATVVADTRPLRVSAEFRRLWLGGTVANLGQQMATVAVAIQVFDITGSSLAVGLLGAFGLVPLVVFGLYGGAIADAFDRRRVLLVASFGMFACSLVLAAQAIADLRQVWVLYAVVAVQSGFFAVTNPARQAIIPHLIGADLLPAANALQQVTWNLGFTVGPLLAGALIATTGGVTTPYLIDVITYSAVLYAVWRLHPVPPEPHDGEEERRTGWAAVAEGLAFLRDKKNLLMTFLIDLNAMIFGMPRALFPAIAGSFYGGGAAVVGALAAAPAVGALFGAVFSGGLGRVRWQGRAVTIAVVVWGAAIALFGFTSVLWIGLVLLAVAGAADMVSAVFRSTILQVATPDALRGRLQGVFIVVVAGGPRLGDVESGGVAALFGERVSVISGGLLCIAGALLLLARYPRFWRYDARHPVA